MQTRCSMWFKFHEQTLRPSCAMKSLFATFLCEFLIYHTFARIYSYLFSNAFLFISDCCMLMNFKRVPFIRFLYISAKYTFEFTTNKYKVTNYFKLIFLLIGLSVVYIYMASLKFRAALKFN